MGRVKNKTPAEVPGVSRAADRNAVLPQVVHDLLRLVEAQLPEGPHPARIEARDIRFRLRRAYPELFELHETDTLQALAEEDGDAIEDAP